jgi:hypothetical protein
MRTAYLGIADEHRLLAWAPECDATRRFLERRQQIRPRQYCFWVVLDDSDARRIGAWQRFGESEVALSLLLQTAEEYGRILPEAIESPCHRSVRN